MSEQEPSTTEVAAVAAEEETKTPAVSSEEEPSPPPVAESVSAPSEEAPVVMSEPEAPPVAQAASAPPVEPPMVVSEEAPPPAVAESAPSPPPPEAEAPPPEAEAPTPEAEAPPPEAAAPPPKVEEEAPAPPPPVVTSEPEPAPKIESVSAPPEAPRVVMNGREPPTTESVGAAEVNRMVNCGFKNYTKLVRGKPKGPLLPDAYLKFADELYNFEFRSDDVMVMAFPKSGTTWVSEIVWALTNIDQLHLMEELSVRDRTLWLDKDYVFPANTDDTCVEMQKFRELFPGENPEDGVVLKLAAAEKSPRNLFTHMPTQFHNPEMLNLCKVIYVARNPKDVCLSWYNFLSNLPGDNHNEFEGEFAEFVEAFKAGYILYSPYWEHIRQAWQQRHHRHLHFLFYEDLKTDIMGELRRLSSFLRLGLGDEQLKKVSELTSFQSMKGREDKLPIIKDLETSFFYKGQVGSWEGTASPLVDARMVAWINENLQGTDIKFTFN